jgi:hypothetical protein
MKFTLVLIAAGALTLAAHIDQPAAQTNSSAVAQLSDQHKEVVVRAAIEAKSHQKTPKEFTPAIGASVPSSVYVHGFTPEISGELPLLKQYWYAYLDQEVVLIDGLQTKVVAVIPLPAPSASVGQSHHGAAEPAGESKPQDGAKNTDSVPAYTSPETIK